jgi:hypothetical protein
MPFPAREYCDAKALLDELSGYDPATGKVALQLIKTGVEIVCL